MNIRKGDVILQTDNDTDLRFYTIVTQEPDEAGYFKGIGITTTTNAKGQTTLFSIDSLRYHQVDETERPFIVLSALPEEVTQ